MIEQEIHLIEFLEWLEENYSMAGDDIYSNMSGVYVSRARVVEAYLKELE